MAHVLASMHMRGSGSSVKNQREIKQIKQRQAQHWLLWKAKVLKEEAK
jgi:hypothetical protein